MIHFISDLSHSISFDVIYSQLLTKLTKELIFTTMHELRITSVKI